MATGFSYIPAVVPMASMADRHIDLSAQMFTPFSAQVKDAGYVFAANLKVAAFLFNGTDSDISLTDIVKVDDGGIIINGITDTETIPAGDSVAIVFSVSKYGPLAFSATFTFDSSCPLDPILTITGTRPLISTGQPRPIDLTLAMEEAYAYADGGDTFYDTLEFSSTGSTEKVLVVHSDEALPTPQGTFLACNFDCVLPETEGAVRGQMQITVDYLPREAQVWLRQTSQARRVMTVRWRQYLAPNQEPSAEYPRALEIISVARTPTGVTATAMCTDLVNMIFPRRLMTTKELPGGII